MTIALKTTHGHCLAERAESGQVWIIKRSLYLEHIRHWAVVFIQKKHPRWLEYVGYEVPGASKSDTNMEIVIRDVELEHFNEINSFEYVAPYDTSKLRHIIERSVQPVIRKWNRLKYNFMAESRNCQGFVNDVLASLGHAPRVTANQGAIYLGSIGAMFLAGAAWYSSMYKKTKEIEEKEKEEKVDGDKKRKSERARS
eukprot:TRINITY_DN19782_c0_g1_i1.p1 TRINITY_DN19782_c0_g1~~TRINITY_DN19782_c0_g1_i1.p1  ORF type:complete len:211 (+),score=52.96 TRINITY_DN19782_c0_g1_i1:41-634(+)